MTPRAGGSVPAGRGTGADRARRRAGGRVVAALALTQTVGYGALYYAFAVLLVPMAADLDASTPAVTGALSAATLAGAAGAVPVGRWLDRRGGRGLMTGGSLVATVLLVLAARVENLDQLYAVWAGIGLVAAAVLYEAAFAVVVSWYPAARARAGAVLAVTVVAGFASSVFLPLTGALVAAYGWRTALLVLAAIHGTITIPLHLLVRPPPDWLRDLATTRQAVARSGARAAVRDRGFRLLVLVFVAQGAAVAVVGVHLVGALVELGHPPASAAGIAGGLGVMSVAGRLATTGAQRRWPTHRVVAGVFAVQAVALLALPAVGSTTAGAVAAVLAFGLGFGVATIARPAILTDRYGIGGYATISGLLAVPLSVTKALAPLAAAFLHQASASSTPVLLAAGAGCLTAAGGILGPSLNSSTQAKAGTATLSA